MRTLSELVDAVRQDATLRGLHEEAQRRMGDDDPAHDTSHALRVACWTIRLGEGAIDERAAIAAALLHDVVNLPKSSPDRARASELSARAAREILAAHDFDAEQIERIAGAIRDHSYARGATPETLLGKALQDADRLEALGAIGVLRCAITGARLGARPFHPEDPWAEHRRLDERRFSVDHFFTKLLTLPETMQTPAGRREAERRAAFLRAFLEQLGNELDRPLSDSGA